MSMSTDLLKLNLDQLLDGDFVLEQTRGVSWKGQGGVEKKLQSMVIAESRRSFYTAGLSAKKQDVENTLQALTRELAALASAGGNSFKRLTEKRIVLLARLQAAYREIIVIQRSSNFYNMPSLTFTSALSSSSTSKSLFGGAFGKGLASFGASAVSSPLASIGLLSTVNMLLMMVQTHSPHICHNVLSVFREQLSEIPALALSHKALGADVVVSEKAMDTICRFLVTIIASPASHELAVDALELMIALSVSRGVASYILTTLNLLLFPATSLLSQSSSSSTPSPSELSSFFSLDQTLSESKPFLQKLEDLLPSVLFPLPNAQTLLGSWTMTDLADCKNLSMATNGFYLFVHCDLGLFKIGTGVGGATVPGVIYARVNRYRCKEAASLVCVGDKLYFRSLRIGPLFCIVLSTEYLTEIGTIKLDGKGSIATEDHTALRGLQLSVYYGDAEEDLAPGDFSSRGAGQSQTTSVEGEKAAKHLLSSLLPLSRAEITKFFDRFTDSSSGSFDYHKAIAEAVTKHKVNSAKLFELSPQAKPKASTVAVPPAPPQPPAASSAESPVDTDKDKEEKDDSNGDDEVPATASSTMTASSGRKLIRASPLISDGELIYALSRQLPEEDELLAEDDKESDWIPVVLYSFDPMDSLSLKQQVPLNRRRFAATSPAPLSLDPSKTVLSSTAGFGTIGLGGGASNWGGGRKGATDNQRTTPMISFGNAPELNFNGDFTIEMQFKILRPAGSNNVQMPLLFRGTSNVYFNLTQYNNRVMLVVCDGTNSVNCHVNMIQGQFPGTSWHHLAVRRNGKRWSIFVDGIHRNSVNSECLLLCTPEDPWIIGRSAVNANLSFSGSIAEVRFWNVSRTDADITKYAELPISSTCEGLVGYWPLNAGYGSIAPDESPSGNPAFLVATDWGESDAENAFPVLAGGGGATGTQSTAKGDPKDEADRLSATTPSLLPTEALFNSLYYSNGESLAVIYPEELVKDLFFNVYNHVLIQIYSIENGSLLQETLTSTSSLHLGNAACFSPEKNLLWMLSSKGAMLRQHKLQPSARLHRLRLRKQAELAKGKKRATFPSSLDFLREYPLDPENPDGDLDDTSRSVGKLEAPPPEVSFLFDSLQAGATSQSFLPPVGKKFTSPSSSTAAASSSSSSAATAADEITVPATVASLLARIDEELGRFEYVDTSRRFGSRGRCSFVVELSPTTFILLTNLLERLQRDYYATEEEQSKRPAVNLLLYAFIISLRMLRTNINYLVTWKLDPATCAFDSPRFRIRERLLNVLNLLLQEAPVSPLSKLAAPLLHTEVCEILTTGLSLFHPDPMERLGVVSSLTREILRLQENANPRRALLLHRYFRGLSKPRHTLSILPAICEAYLKPTEVLDSVHGFLNNLLALSLHQTETSLMCLFQHTARQAAPSKKSSFGKGKRKASSSTNNATSISSSLEEDKDCIANCVAMRDFLANIQTGMIGEASDHGKLDDENPHFVHLRQHALHLCQSCSDLLTLCHTQLQDLNSVDGVDESEIILCKGYVSRILRRSIGGLLLPLMVSFYGLHLESQDAEKMLPELRKLLKAIDLLAAGMPEVVVSEAGFVAGKSQRKMIRQEASVESPHPCNQGISEHELRIAGASQFDLSFDPQTFNTANAASNSGISVTLYRAKGQQMAIPNGSFTKLPSAPIRIRGNSVWIAFNSGFNAGCWGFKATAEAHVEEYVHSAPWLLDLEKTVALVTSKLAGSMIAALRAEEEAKGVEEEIEEDSTGSTSAPSSLSGGRSKALRAAEPETEEEKNAKEDRKRREIIGHWLNNDILQEGLEPYFLKDIEPASHHLEGISLPGDAKDDLSSPSQHIEFVQSLLCDPNTKNICSYLKKNVRVPPFPVPAGVRELMDGVIRHVFVVLLKHNMLVGEALAVEKVETEDDIPEAVTHCWKIAHKMRRWVIQQAQILASEDDAQEEKEEEAEEESLSEKALKELELQKAEALKLLKDKQRAIVCAKVKERCTFLLKLVPAIASFLSVSLERSTLGSSPLRHLAEVSEKQRNAQITFLAWQTTQQAESSLESCVGDREKQFSLLWKHILNFFAEPEIPLDLLTAAILERRDAARCRIKGLHRMHRLLQTSALSSVKRELISSLIPSLSTAQGCNPIHGVAPSLQANVGACGKHLRHELRRAFTLLYELLVDLLREPDSAGTYLLQAIMHALNLQFTKDDYDTIVSLGIFPALHSLIMKGSEDEAAENATVGAHTSAWALLSALTTSILGDQAEEARTRQQVQMMEPVFAILITQLENISRSLKANTKLKAWVPFTSKPHSKPIPTLLGGSAGSREVEQRSRKIAAAGLAFGLTDANGGNGNQAMSIEDDVGDSNAKSITVEDALFVKVLHLFQTICSGWAVARQRFSDPPILGSLFTALQRGSPRIRLLTSRILRVLLEDTSALPRVDAAIPQIVHVPVEMVGIPTAAFLLRQVGQSLISTVNLSYNHFDGTHADLDRMPFTSLYSTDGTMPSAECVMLVRHLLRVPAWEAPLTALLNELLQETLPTLMQALSALALTQLSLRKQHHSVAQPDPLSRQQWEDVMLTLGALAVAGGFVDGLRTGAHVMLADGSVGTVVSRQTAKETVHVARDGEHPQAVAQEDVIPVAEVPFQVPAALEVSRVLQAYVEVLSHGAHERQQHTPLGLLLLQISSRVLRAFFALTSSSAAVEAVRKSAGVQLLSKLAAEDPGYEREISTHELEDRIQALYNETSRRFREKTGVRVTVRRAPTASFTVVAPVEVHCVGTFSNLGGVAKRAAPTISGSLSYVQLGEECTEELCKGKIVMLDAYLSYKGKVRKAIELGAAAVVLVAPDGQLKTDNLLPDKEADGDKKKDGKGKGKRTSAAAASSSSSSPTSLLTSSQQPTMMMGLGGTGFGQSTLGYGGGFGQLGAGLGGGLGGLGGGFGAAGAAAVAPPSPSSTSSSPSKPIDTTDVKELQVKAADPLVLCITPNNAAGFRNLLGLSEQDAPKLKNQALLEEQLVASGTPRKHAQRALEKAHYHLPTATKWLSNNQQWLTEQEQILGDLEKEEKDEKQEKNEKEDEKPCEKAPPFGGFGGSPPVQTAALGGFGRGSSMGFGGAAPTQAQPASLGGFVGGGFDRGSSVELGGAAPARAPSTSSGGVGVSAEAAKRQKEKESQAELAEKTAEAAGMDNLAAAWERFEADTVGRFDEVRQKKLVETAKASSASWHQQTEGLTTVDLLLEIGKTERALLIHYARRSLQHVIEHWPVEKESFEQIGSEGFKQILHLAMSLDELCAAEANMSCGASGRRFRTKVVEVLSAPEGSVGQNGSWLRDLLHSDVSELFSKAAETKLVREKTALTFESEHNYQPGCRTVEEIFIPNARELHFSFAGQCNTFTPSHTLTFYSDEDCTQQIHSYYGYQGTNNAWQAFTVKQPRVWFVFDTRNNANMGRSYWGYKFEVRGVGNNSGREHESLLKGDVDVATSLVELLIRCNKRLLSPGLQVDMLRALPHAPTMWSAQRLCKLASKLFRRWHKLFTQSDDASALKQCTAIVDHLEAAHVDARTKQLLDWDNIAVPAPHIQALLDVLLAGRTFLGNSSQTSSPQEDQAQLADVAPQQLSQFQRGRDGQTYVSFVDIAGKTIVPSGRIVARTNASGSTGNTYNSFGLGGGFGGGFGGGMGGAYTMIADVCLSSGKWYWEVTLEQPSSHVAFGWASSKYLAASASQSLNSNYTGSTWCYHGPNNSRFNHRGVDKYGQVGALPWTAGCVIGIAMDLYDREMSWFVGEQEMGVIYSGFEASQLYPVMSVAPGATVKVNFGAEPFTLYNTHDLEQKGFYPIEDPRIKTSGWLERYKKAAQTTRRIYQRIPQLTLEQEVVKTALDRDIQPDPYPLEFEIHAADIPLTSTSAALLQGSPDQLLQNNTNPFLARRNRNVHVAFKLHTSFLSVSSPDVAASSSSTANASDLDSFVLRQMTVRVPISNIMASSQCSRLMVFVTEDEPDFDALEWCNDFSEEQYKKFMQRKKALGQGRHRDHEPVLYVSMANENQKTISFPTSPRGRYIVLKLVGARNPYGQMSMEYVSFSCILAVHPLSRHLGTPQWEERAADLRTELLKASKGLTGEQWPLEKDADLVGLVQSYCRRFGVEPSRFDCVMLRPPVETLMRFKSLQGVPLKILQSRFSVLKELNRSVTPLLGYVDVSEYVKKDDGDADALRHFGSDFAEEEASDEPENIDELSLSHIVHRLKSLFFIETKQSVFDAMLSIGVATGSSNNTFNTFGSSTPSSNIRITLNRARGSRAIEYATKHEKPLRDGLPTTFGQMYTQLSTYEYTRLKGGKNAQVFKVDFAGEGSIDVGGPYREALVGACADLMSGATPLFCLCPNGRNGVGLNREKYVIRPSASSSLHLAMFEFVGVLIGVALRTKFTLPLDFPSYVWKKLLGEAPDRSDLEAFDKLCLQALDRMLEVAPEQFPYLFGESFFKTNLSDGTEVILKERTDSSDAASHDLDSLEATASSSNSAVSSSTTEIALPISPENRQQFASLVISARLSEANQQLHQMRKGLHKIVPAPMLSLFSHLDLELLVCGNPDIDIAVLKKHTRYASGYVASSPPIKYLWKALRSFTAEEKQLFLRFVWGRNRLPVAASDWTSHFTINMLRTTTPDDSLPVAHTCFFSFDLPPYSSYKVLRAKVLYAITNCLAIDIDFSPTSSSLSSFIAADE